MRLAALATLILSLALSSAHPAAGDDVTVGRLVQEIARVLELDATDARVARESLSRAGLSLPADLDLNAALTEAEVVRVSRAAGLKLTTSRPEARFHQQRLDRYLTTFTGEIRWTHVVRGEGENPGQGEGPGTGNGNGPPFDPFSKGQGKGLGKSKHSPSTPE
ncbi:MAG: hypothetical protein ACYSUM_24600 [Planctomycetota bacterium]|jgi:hypothetical protein